MSAEVAVLAALRDVAEAVGRNSTKLDQLLSAGDSPSCSTARKKKTRTAKVVTRGTFTIVTPQLLRYFQQAASLGHLTVQTDFLTEDNVFQLQSVKYVNNVQIVYDDAANPIEDTVKQLEPGDVLFVHPIAATQALKDLCVTHAVKFAVAKTPAIFKAELACPGAVIQTCSTTNATTIATTGSQQQQQSAPPLPQTVKDVAVDVDDLNAFPWRVCLAGGWLDQPWVSGIYPGSVIVVNIRPHPMFKVRSGLATSTRQAGIKLWGRGIKPPKETPPLLLARMLFGAENPPGVKYISGSQDALGLMLPGINRLEYEGGFWPAKVATMKTSDPAKWLEKVLWLVPLRSRPPGYDPISIKNLTPENIKLLADASSRAWDAICAMDASELGTALLDTMRAWKAILPNTVPEGSREWCAPYDDAHGYLFSGAGGGFLMVVSDVPVKNGFQVSINTIPWAQQPFRTRSLGSKI